MFFYLETNFDLSPGNGTRTNYSPPPPPIQDLPTFYALRSRECLRYNLAKSSVVASVISGGLRTIPYNDRPLFVEP